VKPAELRAGRLVIELFEKEVRRIATWNTCWLRHKGHIGLLLGAARRSGGGMRQQGMSCEQARIMAGMMRHIHLTCLQRVASPLAICQATFHRAHPPLIITFMQTVRDSIVLPRFVHAGAENLRKL